MTAAARNAATPQTTSTRDLDRRPSTATATAMARNAATPKALHAVALPARATTPEPSTKNAPATAGGARYLDQLYPSPPRATKARATATKNKPNRANPG